VYVLLVPETLLMKICMVSSSEDRELMLLMLLERRIVAVVWGEGVWCSFMWWRRRRAVVAGMTTCGCGVVGRWRCGCV
jgi:hypothetical protein